MMPFYGDEKKMAAQIAKLQKDLENFFRKIRNKPKAVQTKDVPKIGSFIYRDGDKAVRLNFLPGAADLADPFEEHLNEGTPFAAYTEGRTVFIEAPKG